MLAYVVDSYTYQLLTLGFRRLSQFIFDLKTPQQRTFMYAYRRGAASDVFDIAYEVCSRYDRGESYQPPIVPFPPRRLAKTDGKNIKYAHLNWFFDEDVDPDLCVWDDDRLERLGYHLRSQEVQLKNYPYLARYT